MATGSRAPFHSLLSLLIWGGCLWLAWLGQRPNTPTPAGTLAPPLPGIHSPSAATTCSHCHRPCSTPPQAHRASGRTAQ